MAATQDEFIRFASLHGIHCPYCGSGNVENMFNSHDEGVWLFLEYMCHSCEKEWFNKYQLIGYQQGI